MSDRRYPDHDLNAVRILPTITPDTLLDHSTPGIADTVDDLIAHWRGLAPDIRAAFPLQMATQPAPANARVMIPGELPADALHRLKSGTVVSIGVPHAFASVAAIDYEVDPTGVNREWPWQLNRLNGFWDILAWAAENGDDEALTALLTTVRQWTAIPVPRDVNGYASMAHRTIDTGIRLARAFAQSLPVILEHADDALLTDLLCNLLMQESRLRWHHRHANWLTMEMNGLFAATLLTPFARETEDYRDYAVGMAHASLSEQVLPDLLQCELSPSYHMVCINNFLPLVERARSIGLASDTLDALESTSLAMTRAVTGLLLSTGGSAEPQDSDRVTLTTLQRLCPDLTAPEGPSVFPHAGYCLLRHQDSSVFFDFGPFGAAHQHQDKLNLVFSQGPRLGVIEYGKQTYEDTVWRRLCLGSGGHNCLLVDGTGQWRSGQDQDLPYPATDCQLRQDATGTSVVGSYDEAYGQHLCNLVPAGGGREDATLITDIHHRRAVHLLAAEGFEGCLLVEDAMVGRREHLWTLLWHLNADAIRAQTDRSLEVLIDDRPFACTWWADRPGDLESACGRPGEDRAHFLAGTPAGWTNMLDHDPRGGQPRSCLRLEYGCRAESWRVLTCFAFGSQVGDLSLNCDAGGIHLQRAGRSLTVAARLQL